MVDIPAYPVYGVVAIVNGNEVEIDFTVKNAIAGGVVVNIDPVVQGVAVVTDGFVVDSGVVDYEDGVNYHDFIQNDVVFALDYDAVVVQFL